MFLVKACITFILGICFIKQVLSLYQQNCECGIPGNGVNRIVNGKDSSPHRYPWIVPIFIRKGLYCGGAIINNRYILTAGHCVRWSNQADMTVIVGAHSLRNANDIYNVEEMILHPEFFSHKMYDENDIALVKVDRDIPFSDTVRPVCLPEKGSSYDNEFAIVAGWGRLSAANPNDPKSRKSRKSLPNILQETFVKVLTNEDCAKTRMAQVITPTVMCAYYPKTDSCQGDSGGPLVYEREPGKMEQIGVVSWGIGCAQETPGIYTKVSKYLDWIYDSTADAVYCRND